MNAFLFTFIFVFIEFLIILGLLTYILYDRFTRKKQLYSALLDFSVTLGKESSSRDSALTKFLKGSLDYDDDSLQIVKSDIIKAEESFNKSFLALYTHDSVDSSTLRVIREEYMHIVSLYQSLLPQAPAAPLIDGMDDFNLAPEPVKEEEGSPPISDENKKLRQEAKVKFSTYLETKGLTLGEVKKELKGIWKKKKKKKKGLELF